MGKGVYQGSYLWRLRQLDQEVIRDAAREAVTIAEFAQRLGLPATHPSKYTALHTVIDEHHIDISHFQGRKAGRGEPANKLSVDDMLVFGVRRKRHQLKWALEQLGVPYQCSSCRLLPVWNDKELVIPIDHIDGNNLNNRRENLRFLCPNCHTQTETWGNKKRMAL